MEFDSPPHQEDGEPTVGRNRLRDLILLHLPSPFLRRGIMEVS